MLEARAPLEQLQVFQAARDLQAERQRESVRELGVSIRPEISVPPTRCSSKEIVLVGAEPRTVWLSFPYVNTLLSYFGK